MIDLTRAFENDNGMISQGVVDPNSIFETIRSFKPTYSGDLLVVAEYFNSLTQVDANRIAKVEFTYLDDFLQTQTVTYYEKDGVTVFSTETMNFTYLNDDIQDIEVS